MQHLRNDLRAERFEHLGIAKETGDANEDVVVESIELGAIAFQQLDVFFNRLEPVHRHATANAALHVSWTTPAVAKAATISLSSGGFSAQAPDTGAYDVPAASNTARTGQRVTIVRSNEVDIAGGLPGSSMKVTVSNRGDTFTVQ